MSSFEKRCSNSRNLGQQLKGASNLNLIQYPDLASCGLANNLLPFGKSGHERLGMSRLISKEYASEPDEDRTVSTYHSDNSSVLYKVITCTGTIHVLQSHRYLEQQHAQRGSSDLTAVSRSSPYHVDCHEHDYAALSCDFLHARHSLSLGQRAMPTYMQSSSGHLMYGSLLWQLGSFRSASQRRPHARHRRGWTSHMRSGSNGASRWLSLLQGCSRGWGYKRVEAVVGCTYISLLWGYKIRVDCI